MFKNLIRKKSKRNILKNIYSFKIYNELPIILEEFIIDKKGNYVFLITTFCYETNFGIINIFTNKKSEDKVTFFIDSKNNELNISDISILNNKNRGIGSHSILTLEKIAKNMNCNKMSGFLFSVDQNNRNRQIHFYEKNGFTINFENSNKCGREIITKTI